VCVSTYVCLPINSAFYLFCVGFNLQLSCQPRGNNFRQNVTIHFLLYSFFSGQTKWSDKGFLDWHLIKPRASTIPQSHRTMLTLPFPTFLEFLDFTFIGNVYIRLLQHWKNLVLEEARLSGGRNSYAASRSY
jgi:hypothetical protein